jgi:hypothetical protein
MRVNNCYIIRSEQLFVKTIVKFLTVTIYLLYELFSQFVIRLKSITTVKIKTVRGKRRLVINTIFHA